jgi:GNAT superfamily N-acetyltransferase
MTQDYDIRQAVPSDMDAILAFQRAAIAAVPEAYYPRPAREAWMRKPALGMPELIVARRYYVAESKGILVAGGGWQPSDKESGAASVRGVFVHPLCKTRGLGRQIVRTVESAAAAAGYTRILVPSALNATGFYEKLGYHVIGPGGFDLEGVFVGTCNMWKSVA